MKLFNTIAIFDVYVVAETSEAARAVLLTELRQDDFMPSEIVGVEASREQAIRNAWRDQKPFVGDDISDEDFAKVKGKNTIQIFEMIYTKRG